MCQWKRHPLTLACLCWILNLEVSLISILFFFFLLCGTCIIFRFKLSTSNFCELLFLVKLRAQNGQHDNVFSTLLLWRLATFLCRHPLSGDEDKPDLLYLPSVITFFFIFTFLGHLKTLPQHCGEIYPYNVKASVSFQIKLLEASASQHLSIWLWC